MSIAAQGTKGAPTTQSGALWELHVKLCLAGRELILGNVPGGAWRQTKEIGHILGEEGWRELSQEGAGTNASQSSKTQPCLALPIASRLYHMRFIRGAKPCSGVPVCCDSPDPVLQHLG